VGYGQKVQGGIFVHVVIFVIRVVRVGVVVLRFAQASQSHDHNLILGLALSWDLSSLRSGDNVRRVRVRRPFRAQVVTQNIEG
jgi:hypothetical protein